MQHLSISLLAIIAFAFVGCNRPKATDQPRLLVYAAASLSPVALEIAEAYEAASGVGIDFHFASSGTLSHDIMANPEADVFISSDDIWIHSLHEYGYIESIHCPLIARNSLVIIASPKLEFEFTDAEMIICNGNYQFIAVGAPEFVPAGRHTKFWLQKKECPEFGNLWNRIATKIVRTLDTKSIINYVKNTPDALGIVYHTDYISAMGLVNAVYFIPVEETLPINYSVTPLESSQRKDLAAAFIEYLKSEQTGLALANHGFQLP